MPATPKTERTAAAHTAPFFKGLVEMPQLNTKMLTRANEIMSEAAKAIWASEVELARIEAEEGSKLLFLAKPAGDPAKLAAETFAQWQNSSEKILSQMRGTGDLMRKCGWELFQLYSENMKLPCKTAEAE